MPSMQDVYVDVREPDRISLQSSFSCFSGSAVMQDVFRMWTVSLVVGSVKKHVDANMLLHLLASWAGHDRGKSASVETSS